MSVHRFARLSMLIALLIGALIACGSDDDTTTTSSTTSSTAATTTSTTTTTTEPTTSSSTTTTTAAPCPTDVNVNVFWAWVIDSIPAGTPERLAAGARGVTGGINDEQRAMEELLAGPNVVETEIGMTSNIPTSVQLLGLSIVDGVATVDLSGSFEESGGTLGETFRLAQVVFTLTQFDTVDTVDVWIDGESRDAVGSHGIPAIDLSRADFSDVRPLILVTSPMPGDVVGNSFEIQGESNTFEATVDYVVVDGERLIVDEGFTTATAGNGEWGTFSIDIDLDPPLDGRAGIIVFETSAKDGSQQNVVEYPIHIDASAAIPSEACVS